MRHPHSVTWATGRARNRTRTGATIRRTRAATTGIAATIAALLLLSACGSNDTPGQITDIRWQVTAIGGTNFDAATQARTWIALGASTMTGASGCVQFTGKVEWSRSQDDKNGKNGKNGKDGTEDRDARGTTGTEKVTLSDMETTSGEDCGTGDTYNAEQMRRILETPDLRWTFDDDSQMRHLRLWVDKDPERGISFAG